MLTIAFYLRGCFVGCTWLTHLSWASYVFPSCHHLFTHTYAYSSIWFPSSFLFLSFKSFHRLNLNVGGLEMKLKALAWMMRSFTLHMHILVYLCVFVCKCRQMSTWRMAWGIRGQTVPSGPTAWNWPVSIKSTALSLHLSGSPFSPPFCTYPPTHWQTGLGYVRSQWSSDGLCEAAMLEATGPA